MRNSLFLKIYLTLIACLVVVALAGAAFVRLGSDDDDRGWRGRRDAFLAAMLPAGAHIAETQRMLERLAGAFDADIALYDPQGRLIAGAGEPVALAPPAEDRRFGGNGRRSHMRMQLEDGRTLVARLSAPFGPSRGNPLGWLALVAGITALVAWPVVRHLTRRLETLRHGVEAWGEGDLARRVPVNGRDEVAAVASSFNSAAERIETLVAAHRTLLANASHELRSPLARLRMAVDLYEDQPTAARKREIVRNLGELDELVEEILLASRLDHGAEGSPFESVDLLALAAEEGARHGLSVSGEAVTVMGEARLLGRLVRNLMQNALRHGAPPVLVRVERKGGKVELSVRDHGPGIAPSDGERVFEPFYRPAGRGESAGGWGLGLSLVRQIAERHGAGVRHEAPDDGGARFVVAFPAASQA